MLSDSGAAQASEPNSNTQHAPMSFCELDIVFTFWKYVDKRKNVQVREIDPRTFGAQFLLQSKSNSMIPDSTKNAT